MTNIFGVILKYLWYDAIFEHSAGNTVLDTLPPSIYYELLPLVTFVAILAQKIDHFCVYLLEAFITWLKHGTKIKVLFKKKNLIFI